MKNSKLYSLLLVFVIPFISCNKIKNEPVVPENRLDFNITYKVDNEIFATGVNKFINKAGNSYSITRLNYYISQICLIKADNTTIPLKDFQYLDAEIAKTNQMSFSKVQVGNYIGIQFNIGLDSLHNLSEILPSSAENINMVWPNMMGGGYHFLKLEGYFLDPFGASYGYAMHLGTNACLVPVKLFKNISITADSKFPISVVMNINEWYKNPNTYDFNTDGNYIMGNGPLMKKITQNGNDVFSF